MGEEKEEKTYVITAAQGIQNPHSSIHYGGDSSKGKPNKELIRNIERYVEKNEGELEICAIPGSYINEIELDEFFHKRDDVYMEKNAWGRLQRQKDKEKELRENWEKNNSKSGKEMPMHYFWEEIPETSYKSTGKRLNSNINVVGIPEPPQNKDPLVGKQVFTKKYGGNSIIIPSPKQRLKPVASGQAGKYPKLMITTGCCTHPNYNTTNRNGFQAEEAHRYGFVTVDIIDDKIFLPRIVPALKNGTFVDLGIQYSKGKKIRKIKSDALIIGDSHVSEINPKIEAANREMLEWFRPKNIHYNDVFNARSINIHELDDEIEESNKFAKGISNLEEELVETGRYIRENANIAKKFKGEIFINYSNHDDMLYRWLSKGHYKKDKENRLTAYKILGEGIDRHSSFEVAVKKFAEIPNNVHFLKPGQDRIYWGYQCAAHGHLGKNGARGTLKNLQEGYIKVIMGHVHQIEIDGDSISVGTSSKIPLDYQLGRPSTSTAGNAVIYSNGLVQVIPIIKSMWRKKSLDSFL